MVKRSPSGDIDITVLFIHHEFDGIIILIGNGIGKSRKIIDMSTSLFCQQKYNVLAAAHAFSGNDYVSSFFWKGNMNLNLLMTKSAIPLTLKDKWCYDNVDATTDVDFCTFDF